MNDKHWSRHPLLAPAIAVIIVPAIVALFSRAADSRDQRRQRAAEIIDFTTDLTRQFNAMETVLKTFEEEVVSTGMTGGRKEGRCDLGQVSRVAEA